MKAEVGSSAVLKFTEYARRRSVIQSNFRGAIPVIDSQTRYFGTERNEASPASRDGT